MRKLSKIIFFKKELFERIYGAENKYKK